MPYQLYLPKGKRVTLDEFKSGQLDILCRERPKLKRMSRKNIISGIYIGTYLSDYLGVKLNNVPGFFTINGLWCFNYTSGILIPVRNMKQEITGFQIRTDSGKTRYITVSSKGFKNGTAGNCRVHFPIANPPIGSGTRLYLTEGPD